MGGVSGRNAVAGRSVTSKVLAILDAFTRGTTELNLTQLSRASGLPLPTVHRLTGELVAWGALQRDPRGVFRIGERLWEVGSLTPQRTSLREIALPFMGDLYEATHENVQLAVLQGRDALFVEKLSGLHSVPIVTRVGGRLPLHATGVGKVLLAYAPESFIGEVLAADLPRLTPYTIVDPEELRLALTEVRRLGYASTREEMTLGSVSVAAPIFGPEGRMVAAMSLVVSADHADLRRLAMAVRTAAIGLSRRVAGTWDGALILD
jgi:DNA-binding IclR family transcriptional regulator